MSEPKLTLPVSFEASNPRGLRANVVLAILCLGSAMLSPLAQAATSITTTTAFDYNAAGVLKKQMVEPTDSNLCVVVEHQRDPYGHVTGTTTRNCSGATGAATGAQTEAAAPAANAPAVFVPRTTTYAFTADQRFVATTTNAVGLSQTRAYDARFGAVSTLTDPNQIATSWTYDGLGRRAGEIRPDGTRTRWDYVYCSNGGIDGQVSVPSGAASASCSIIPAINGTPIYYIQVTPVAADGVTQIASYTRTYFDEVGREVRVETQGFDGTLIYQDLAYNGIGEVSKKSYPYYNGQTAYWVTFTYDALGRVTEENRPTDTAASGAITHVDFNGLVITRTDPLGHATVETRSVVDQVATITDAKGGVLTHTHDALGNLTATQDANGNVIRMTYDLRSRRLALNDPDLGQVTSVYNAASDLVRQTDAKGQVTTFTYDQIRRVTLRAEPTLTSRWYYDNAYADGSACSNGKGRLCEATSGNGYARRHAYDGLGRPSSTRSVIGAAYNASVTYDGYGRIAAQAYPSGLAVTNSYTSAGYLRQVIDARTGAALWTANVMDAADRVIQYTYGNGVTTTDQYFAPSGRLGSSLAGAGNGVQNLAYARDAGGRLNSQVDALTGVSASYGYDELNRLTSESRSGGSVAGTQTIAWAYDSIGNIANRTEGGVTNTYAYNLSGSGSVRPHAVASISGSVNGYANPSYAYDANGNLNSGAGRTLTWASFDKVMSISRGGARLDYLYDSELQRARESYYLNGALQRTTIYLNPANGAGLFYEEETGVAGTKKKHYINAGGAAFAVITCGAGDCTVPANTTTQYLHKDRLGSTVVVTNAAGGVVERLAYEPFGKRRNSNGLTDPAGTLPGASTDRGYTGHEHLDEVALINMNGRVFDPALGRFMSADPTVPHVFELQSYNRYSYVRNSPTGGIDPSGYADAGGDGEGEGGDGEGGGDPSGGVTVTGTRGGGESYGSSPSGLSIPSNATNVSFSTDAEGFVSLFFLTPAQPTEPGVISFPKHNIVGLKSARAALGIAGGGAISVRSGNGLPAWARALVKDAFDLSSLRGTAVLALVFYSGPSDNGEDGRIASINADGAKAHAALQANGANSAPPPAWPAYPGDDPTMAPPGYGWKGKPGSKPGDKDGNYVNPETGESLRPDLDHLPPVGPHWDHRDQNGDWGRIFPDGRREPKK